MATYIILASWTAEGIANIRQSPTRLEKAKKAFEAAGAKLKSFYLTMGRHDMVVIAEAPDDETIAKVALIVASAGAIRTETLRAFAEDEYRNIIAALP